MVVAGKLPRACVAAAACRPGLVLVAKFLSKLPVVKESSCYFPFLSNWFMVALVVAVVVVVASSSSSSS